jgi:tetratricopeptide (TPR) repeat protein
MKGNALVQKKDYDAAIKAFENALKIDPKNAKAHLLLGLTYANKGDLARALKFTKYALSFEKSYAAFHNLALVYANKEEYQNAVDAYESALEISPESAADWYQLGLLHTANGSFDKGIEAYKKAIELNTRLDDAYVGLGSAYYWSGDKAAAENQVKRMKALKMSVKADALDSWIRKKELKKKEVDSKSTAKEEASPSPSPSPLPSTPA